MLFLISCEYHASSYDSSRTIEVIQLLDSGGTDYTFLVDHAKRYLCFSEIAEDIAGRLNLSEVEVELEEV
jgi:hypothetical protein